MSSGRYEVVEKDLVDTFDTEAELTAWLQYSNTTPLLIHQILWTLRRNGICVLMHKGIVIRDTDWTNKTSATTIDWSAFKRPTTH